MSSLLSSFELRYIHSCIPGLLPGDTCEIRCRFPDFLGDPVVAMCSTENTATWQFLLREMWLCSVSPGLGSSYKAPVPTVLRDLGNTAMAMSSGVNKERSLRM